MDWIPISKTSVFDWSDWISLQNPDSLSKISQSGGIFRVTHRDTGSIEFVGRSYTNLQRRIKRLEIELRSDEEPGDAPFSAAPILWSLQQRIGPGYLVSWKGISSGDVDEIDGVWASYLAILRNVMGKSPTANFGKTIRISDGIDSNTEIDEFDSIREYEPSIENPVTWENWRDVTSNNWLGLPWKSLDDREEIGGLSEPLPNKSGVYRMWEDSKDTLDVIEATSDIGVKIRSIGRDIKHSTKVSYFTLPISGKPTKTAIEVDLLGAHYLAKNIAPTEVITNESIDINDKVKELIHNDEENRVEYKDPRAKSEDIAKEIVALSNGGGGNLFIGINDETKGPTGIPNIDGTETRVLNIVRDNIQPRIRLQTRRVPYEGDKIIWIQVPPAKNCLYSAYGEFKIRSGSSSESLGWSDIENHLSDNPDLLGKIIATSEIEGSLLELDS